MSRNNKKRKLEGEDQVTTDSEEEGFFSEKLKEEMESMWEIPQIFQFLHLTKEVLNISHLTIYEVERMFLIPRASKQLANIMTCLLSCPMTKTKLCKIPLMPYEFWTNILMHKMKNWFKLYYGKHRNVVKVLETIGIEPEFWNVFSDASILDGKDFEDLSFKQRVWLLKTICDTVMHTRKTIQEEMAKQTWENQAEINLGTDRHGARYIYFPQFIATELRIYKHCMNNKILSTVKPFIPKTSSESDTKSKVQNLLDGKVKRNRKRKPRWQNGLSSKAKRRIKKKVDKEVYTCNCYINSTMNSSISKDTGLSCTSSHSQNNNNNNINLHSLDRKRTRSSSKTSVETAVSNSRECSNIKSSGYDTSISDNSQSVNISLKESTFKGFSKSANKKHSIAVINRILNRLETEIDIKTDIEISTSVCKLLTRKNSIGLSLSENRSSDHCLDNLSNNSKTDDEKLNEIIEIENTMLKGKSVSITSRDINNLNSIPLTSKSDDEKLNETQTSITSKISQTSNGSPNIINECDMTHKEKPTTDRNVENKKENENIINKKVPKINQTQTCMRRSLRNKITLRMQHKLFHNGANKIINSKINSVKTNLKNTDETTSFKEMLKDLGISNFRLVADSVETLRDLISSFSLNKIDTNNDDNDILESHPLCEVILVNKLTELLNSVEKFETVLKDTTRKAKSKLQKEWTNFKEGMEDQDSSGESGHSSNWWILGSQGYSLPNSGDTTLQTLQKSTLSPVVTQNARCEIQEQCTSEKEKEYEETNGKEPDTTSNDREQAIGGVDRKEEHQEEKGEEIEYDTKEEGQQTRRVLRTRGMSSYTEQLYFNEEIYENELDKWTDIEAMYATPGTQTCTSAANSSSKIGHNDDWSEKEDSDQDWILPSSRKRKNKRPCKYIDINNNYFGLISSQLTKLVEKY
ncbi:hypothetical protein KPH14_008163 [Odynerus spinipes]|uniref:Uncharacterized bromodomain-containing protein 10 helical domain-containing protein n=1 Tax=Odynerus spinipes TaxID=1348599 RepID=A0AAD9RA76_9HYME|nr:hypothetical protein KPH14_008163 [Odynerus spinipes]